MSGFKISNIVNSIKADAKFSRFLQDEDAATAIEYTLIAAGIGIAIVAVVFSIGNALESLFSTVSTWMAAKT